MTLTKSEREVIRSIAATVVGVGVSYVVKLEAHLTPLELVAYAVPLAGAYAGAVRWAEAKWPALGWLLGVLPETLPTG